MTAGRGVVHSEMPEQVDGRLRGFQLWINLPAKEKMKPAQYRDIHPTQVVEVNIANGAVVKVIAGSIELEGQTANGPIQGLSTEPVYVDAFLPSLSQLSFTIPKQHHAFIYVFEGQVQIGDKLLKNHSVGILSEGEKIDVRSLDKNARMLVLAGKPIGEPVVQYGPFVMNTREEVEQAVRDYQQGTLVG
jgi:redox-sensitive bicupin YhaK (pirin superfamily)